MFYLSEFFKILKENKMVAMIFIASTISLISISHNFYKIESRLSDVSTKQGQPYFNALINEKMNLSSVIRRMKSLPGVVTVESIKDLAINNEITKLKKVYGEDLLKNLAVTNYKKIKIELEHGIKAKNQTLIREYLQRLVGKDSVTIGVLKAPKQIKAEKGNIIQLITTYGKWYFMAILGGLWIISIALLIKPFHKSSYIIQKFQRTQYSYLKLAGVGMLVIALPTMIVNMAITPKIEPIAILLMLLMFAVVMISSVFSRK